MEILRPHVPLVLDCQIVPKVTVKLTAQYTRETLLIQGWVDAAEEAKRVESEPPPFPPLTETDCKIVGEMVTRFSL